MFANVEEHELRKKQQKRGKENAFIWLNLYSSTPSILLFKSLDKFFLLQLFLNESMRFAFYSMVYFCALLKFTKISYRAIWTKRIEFRAHTFTTHRHRCSKWKLEVNIQKNKLEDKQIIIFLFFRPMWGEFSSVFGLLPHWVYLRKENMQRWKAFFHMKNPLKRRIKSNSSFEMR